MAAALDAFVPGVVAHVIRFVWLEQVVGPRTIALFQEALQMRGTRVTESLDIRANLLNADRTLRVSVRALTLFLTRKAEHCRGTPISLWGFHVTEQALQPQHQHKPPDLQTLRQLLKSRRAPRNKRIVEAWRWLPAAVTVGCPAASSCVWRTSEGLLPTLPVRTNGFYQGEHKPARIHPF